MPATPKAYSYLRFSTPEQAKGDSRRRQSSLATDYAARHGLVLADDSEYQDLGVSAFRGKNLQTGALGEFLEAVRAGAIPAGSFLLVESLDRISRDAFRLAVRALEDICEAGVVVVTLNDGARYDASRLNDVGSFFMAVLGFIRANEESVTKSKRLSAAWENKRAKAAEGFPQSRMCPAWLLLKDDRSAYEVIEEKAAVVRRIFEELSSGISPHTIVYKLNTEGVPTFSKRGSTKNIWYRSFILKLLESQTVIGTYQPARISHEGGKRHRILLDPIPNYYPAVVSEEAFNRATLVAASKSVARGRHASKPLRNAFSGLARCSRCGGLMVRVYKGKAPKGGEYLVCSRARAGAGCSYEALRYIKVEDTFTAALPGLLADLPSGNDDHIRAKLDNNETASLALSDMLENVMTAIEAAPTSRALSDRLAKLEAASSELKEEEADLLAQLAAASSLVLEKRVENALACLATMDEDRRPLNAALRGLLSSVVFDYDAGVLCCEWIKGGSTELLFRFPREASQ
jgi:DNA invertase Pin-like site-specific DNA recombinase